MAQEVDPSEVFLKAYMTAQQGEKLERENQFKPALAKFRFAGSMLEELKKNHGDWQPAIVEYRGRKIGEAILRVQSKIATQKRSRRTRRADRRLKPKQALPNVAPVEPSVDLGTQTRRVLKSAERRRRRSRTRPRNCAPESILWKRN